MNDKELKQAIQSAVKSFASSGTGSLTDQTIAFFQTIGYDTNLQNPFTEKTFASFKESYLEGNSRFNEQKAFVEEWKSIDLLFQLTRAEVSDQKNPFSTGKVKWQGEDKESVMESYLFFAVELYKSDYSRTALAQISREINKVFPMPVMILFKHGEYLTLSVINRRLNKKDEQKDVLEKVTLIKDISIEKPHRAHIEILFDLSFDELKRVHGVTNFVELHNAWQKTLDARELNKRFYSELSNWYFWAVNSVSFPNDIDNDKDSIVFNSESIIRLLTRLIFTWFIKEKNLIPENIFDERSLSKLIKGFNENGSTVYYRAILQNLFFATLNQRIEDRAFATEGTFAQKKKNYGIKNLYRYSTDFKISQDEVIELFKDVPFLNGGLFDCLDIEDRNGKVLYLDGFSRNPKKQAQVSDELFFSHEKTIDLSAVYDDKRKKNETVKGLFEIFSHYKFTITENTPIEEEVALDPELLGRVFENLLASYNPETKTTARKQTGSFYTPREIVNYMVDESIMAYLKQKLETESRMKLEDAQTSLEFLFAYNEKEHLFDDEQAAVLIKAIDSCKIIDPACGSGAFPMGILHKLVYILHKLDPHNEKWRELQRQKAIKETEEAFKIGNKHEREDRLKEISDIFENNSDDYGRKLYLIENCIFGVDIQPIATQISKLRFFISLIVDQKTDNNKDNFGIRPLPNLETKFVAANTLIGIEAPKQLKFFDPKVKVLEERLKDVRHRLFSANHPVIKRKLREEDQELRKEMGKVLESAGWSNESARQLAAWNPYNQNVSSPFFDQEWMFGVIGGFDVVIGNPPYIDSESMVKHFPRLREAISLTYKTTKGNWDLYIAFYEKAFFLLKKNSGVASYITPNKWLSAPYGKALRAFFHKTSSSIVNCSKIKVFEAGNTPVIFSFGALCNSIIVYEYDENWKIHLLDKIDKTTLKGDNWGVLLSSNIKTLRFLEAHTGRVKNMCSVENPFSTSEAYILSEIVHNSSNYSKSFRLITTGSIDPFETLWGKKTTSYLKNKYEYPIVSKSMFRKTLPRRFEQQNCPKITISGMRYFEAFYDIEGNFLSSKSTIIAKSFKDRNTGYYLLGLFNSSLISFYIKESYSALGIDGGISFSKEMIEEIPLPTIHPINEISIISNFMSLMKILGVKEEYYEYFLSLLNAIVYEIYFSDKIKAADAEVLKHLTNLSELRDDLSDEKKLDVIKKVYKELSDPKHPVIIAMKRQKNVSEVRIVEGLL
jgi:hypothetical protein